MKEENDIKKKEIQKKIKFLKGYYWTSKDLEKLEAKLKEITFKIYTIKAGNITAMPKSNTKTDISDLLIQQEKYQEEITKKILEQETKRENIEKSIDSLEESKLKVILKYAYLENCSYKKISAELELSERHIRRLHNEAICFLVEMDRKKTIVV